MQTVTATMPKLERQKAPRSKVIDAARGAAALWVLAYHATLYLTLPLCGGLLGSYPDWLGTGHTASVLVDPRSFEGWDKFLYALIQPCLSGHLGVAMFFVISGFCIHMPLAHKQLYKPSAAIAAWSYCKRRFFRLYPTHLFALIGSIVLVSATHHLICQLADGDIIPIPLTALVAHFAMLQAQLTDTNAYLFYYNANLWSLETELQLYVVYLLVSRFTQRANWPRLLAILALVDLAYFRISFSLPHSFECAWAVKTFFFGHLYEWYLGAYLAHQFVRTERNLQTMPVLAGLAALLGIGRCALPGFDTTSTNDMVFATAFAILLFWALSKEQSIVSKKTGLMAAVFKFLIHMGERSYSLYLWQSPVIRSVIVAVMITAPWIAASYLNALLVSLFASLLSIVISLVAFDLVERHFINGRPRSQTNYSLEPCVSEVP